MDDVRVYWTGPRRKRVWPLHSGVKGVRLAGGLAGQHFPDFSQIYAEPARKRGRLYRGTRWNGRKVGLNVFVGDPLWANKVRDGAHWRNLDASWHDDLDEAEPGRLCVVTNRGYRWLPCRLESAADPANVSDPAYHGMERYSYVLGSEDSHYTGFTERFKVYDLAAGVSSARLTNPGDVTVYPRLRVTGPGLFMVGSGARATWLPRLYAGEWLDIDTDPDVLSLVDNRGRNRRSELQPGHDLSIGVEPGATVSYAVQAVEYASPQSGITAMVTPKYRRAW